jgi:hypothetical protein
MGCNTLTVYFVVHVDVVRPRLWTAATNGPIVYPARWYMSMDSHGEMILAEDTRNIRRKFCPSATLSTTNLTWTDPGANPGFRVERPATNRLSHGMAYPNNTKLPVQIIVNMEMTAFWYLAPCSLVEIDRRFVGAYCFYHQGGRVNDGGSKHLWNVDVLPRDCMAPIQECYLHTPRCENLKSHLLWTWLILDYSHRLSCFFFQNTTFPKLYFFLSSDINGVERKGSYSIVQWWRLACWKEPNYDVNSTSKIVII